MLQIKTTGVEDFIDGSANIKSLIIGGPGAGKTRMSSYWPKPIYLDCENGRGSLADRNMPYVEIKHSKDMLDALEYLKSLERTPKSERQFQTVVVDTADSFQRVVKDEWVQQTKAGSFTGYDAWGYLDTKMQLLFTRLLNLDYNVIVLVHYTSKEHKDGDNTVREFALQLQGNVKDTIYNDFGLVGWLGTYWAAGEDGRVQKRGLTFEPTPDKPFLKDRFNVTPKWLEINFSDNDYQQLFEAFFNRPEFEELSEGGVVGEIPDAERLQAQARGPISPPTEGGALPPRPAAEVPLEKMVKGELEATAKALGIPVRGNMLKAELVTAIQAKRAQGSTPKSDDAAGALPPAASSESTQSTQTAPSGDNQRGFDAAQAMSNIAVAEPVRHQDEKPVAEGGHTPQPATPDPTSQPSSNDSAPAETADAQPASPATSEQTTTSSGPVTDEAPPMSVGEVANALGAEVISVQENDPSPTPQPATPPTTKPNAPTGPSACADCGRDLSGEWADPSKKDYIRLSFIKFRRYLCTGCYATATSK